MSVQSAIVLASRGRPENVIRLVEACRKTEFRSDIWVIIDEDDWERKAYERNANQYDYGYLVVENYTGGSGKALDIGAELLLDDELYDHYDYFAILSDDMLPRTLFWDYIMMLNIPYDKNVVVYGNDKLQGQNLPTACMVSRSIPEAVGSFGLPGVIHLYSDNFMKKLGDDINGLVYKEDVIIEHMHPYAGKAELDEGYKRVNDEKIYLHDEKVFRDYVESDQYKALVKQLRNP